MDRISVVGCTGSGKTRTARSLAESLGIPHLELDSVYHQPEWTPLPDEEFLSVVDSFTSQVTRRTLSRGARRRELWNGNRESLWNLAKWNPEENIIRWAWTRFEPTRSRYESRTADPRWSDLTIHRLRSRSETLAFVEALAP